MTQKKKPVLRFKGFTDDWEQRKIGDCFTERKESMPKGELLSVTINEGIKRFSELERHDSSNQDKSKYKKVCIGDIAYNSMRMWQGASGFSDYEGIVSPAYTVLKPHDGIDARFVSYLFKTKDLIHVFQINSQGITSDNWNLKFPVLSTINIKIPEKIEEQNKIAEFLAKLDNLITLHQRKYNKLQNLKKYFLEKMFPQNGKRVPEIRFAGFTDDWEQRKYSNVINLISGQDFEPSQYNENKEGIPYLTGASCIENGHTVAVRWTQTPRCIAEKGDTVLVCKGSGYGTIAVVDQEKAHIARQFMAVKAIDGEIDKAFNYYLLYSVIESIKKDARGLIAGIARDAVLNQPVLIPNIDEQVKIAHSLTNLDNLITLHQRKLEKLQNLKKAALDKMFV
ncbi:restriction endonuclease subunit S [uncultured Acidaminococcus sp.]|uniref:restriction endonuclease subunit S n=1 Tax=uncultured Acidaminococcus sp. TaxID=352152 RepID=UPI002941CB89|nr:restriction endonuclease subunit S [uncultured Acidaminococcus sp.]